ncbi:MAG TPA: hypothetical protein VFQ72_01200 [Candidatus Paceibacterota bacterium]|nr:hypothetical protein [Candidatus Paceibacterota bacterium]
MASKKNLIIGIAAVIAVAAAAYLLFGMPKNGPVVITRELTQADNGKAVDMNRGDRLVIKLGDKESWALSIKPTGVIDRAKNIAAVRGSQGVYTANTVGTAVVTAQGRPVCASGTMCAQYIIEFAATVNVK